MEDPATLDDMDNLDTTTLKSQLLTAAFKVSMGAGATVVDRPGAGPHEGAAGLRRGHVRYQQAVGVRVGYGGAAGAFGEEPSLATLGGRASANADSTAP